MCEADILVSVITLRFRAPRGKGDFYGTRSDRSSRPQRYSGRGTTPGAATPWSKYHRHGDASKEWAAPGKWEFHCGNIVLTRGNKESVNFTSTPPGIPDHTGGLQVLSHVTH